MPLPRTDRTGPESANHRALRPLSFPTPSLFKDLGIGVGLRPDHYDEFLGGASPDSVRWVEVVTENFLDWPDRPAGRPRQILEEVRRELPVALHGVSLSLGSADPLNHGHLSRLKSLAQAIEPALITDHLCWTGVDGINLHDLLPLPFTESALEHVARRIQSAQDFLGQRIAIENVSSYVQFADADLTEWDFLSEVAKRADCGILLDVNNVYVSSRNHGFDPRVYIQSLPFERIAQIHLAGHRRRGELLIDTHDEPVCPEVWELYRYALGLIGRRSAMIERDDAIPEWDELEKEIITLGRITDEHGERSHSHSVSA